MQRLVIASALLAATCTTNGPPADDAASAGAAPAGDAPVRVILIVGDGAGIAHWSAGYQSALEDEEALAIASFPVVGLIDPANITRPLPESASSATAFATGVRTYYNAVGVGPDLKPRESVLEAAEAAGLATGVLTTTLIIDGTPAAFLAHARTRNDKAEIASQIAKSPAEVLMGDGREWFDGTQRGGSANLLADMDPRYVVVESGAELRALDPDTVHALLGFFDTDAGRDPSKRDPSLAEMTEAALAVLDRDPQGFFLLVENEHTDHATHEHLPLKVVAGEIRALDAAVRVALEYRERHPETLILVAADHETGGLSLVPTFAGPIEARYAWGDHTTELVPLFAIGPGAEQFGGIHRNDQIGRLLKQAVAGRAAVTVGGDVPRAGRGPGAEHE